MTMFSWGWIWSWWFENVDHDGDDGGGENNEGGDEDDKNDNNDGYDVNDHVNGDDVPILLLLQWWYWLKDEEEDRSLKALNPYLHHKYFLPPFLLAPTFMIKYYMMSLLLIV